MKYYQCELHQGGQRLVGWIEERGAREGLRVPIRTKDGLWRVARVYDDNPVEVPPHLLQTR